MRNIKVIPSAYPTAYIVVEDGYPSNSYVYFNETDFQYELYAPALARALIAISDGRGYEGIDDATIGGDRLETSAHYHDRVKEKTYRFPERLLTHAVTYKAVAEYIIQKVHDLETAEPGFFMGTLHPHDRLWPGILGVRDDKGRVKAERPDYRTAKNKRRQTILKQMDKDLEETYGRQKGEA
jgi:hypothetical protein